MTSDTFIGHLDVWQLLKHPLFKLHSGKIKTASRKRQVFLPMSWFCFQILQFPSFVVVVVINTTFTHFKSKETKTHPLLLLPDEWQDTQPGFKHLVFVSQQTRGSYNEISFSKKLKAQSFATNWSLIKGKRKKGKDKETLNISLFIPSDVKPKMPPCVGWMQKVVWGAASDAETHGEPWREPLKGFTRSLARSAVG